MIFECVVNISEGQSTDLVDSIAHSGMENVCNVHMDPDHHRSVITIASNTLDEVYTSTQSVVSKAFASLSIDDHDGVHPRLGVVDVVPFVSYNNSEVSPTRETIEAAHSFGQWANKTFDVPIFFYDFASPVHTTLPFVRKNAFITLPASLSSSHEDSAMCVGAREPLIAININLDSTDLFLAKNIALAIRESSGGIKNVRALGLTLERQNKVQVSMNIIDAINVNAQEVCEKIRELANNITSEVELVGLVPQLQFEKWSKSFREWSALDETCTVEYHL